MAGRDRMTIEEVVRQVLRDEHGDVIRESVRAVDLRVLPACLDRGARGVPHHDADRAAHAQIDFGDGRKMERTLTGNSIHYVLDSEGRLIDALPGVFQADELFEGILELGSGGGRS